MQSYDLKHKTQAGLALTLVALMCLSPWAEAKRLGGGSSHGMTRSGMSSSSSPVRPYSPPPSYSPTPSPSTGLAGRKVGMGTVAAGALAAGAAGYALGHSNSANANPNYNQNGNGQNGGYVQNGGYNNGPVQNQSSGFSWFWPLLLAGIGYFLYRRFKSKQVAQPVGAPAAHYAPSPTAVPASAAPYGNSETLADGTATNAFLRQARSTFLHLQAMNQGSNVEELRRYFTPDMFADISRDISTNAETADFPQLNAQLINSTQENGQYIASVRFNGMVSESLNAPTTPFSEVWHFVKPLNGGDWVVAGIQQEN